MYRFDAVLVTFFHRSCQRADTDTHRAEVVALVDLEQRIQLVGTL